MTKEVITISELYAKFLLEQKFRNNSKRTLEYYKENLTRFINWLESDSIFALSTDKWKEYGVYLHEMATKRNGDKYSESSIQGFMRAIKAFYNYGIELGVIDDKVIRQLKLPKAHNKEERILDDDEIDTLFKCIDSTTRTGLRNKCFIALMLDSGLRRGEIPRLNFADLDLKTKTMIIKGKGSKQRVVPMGEISAALLSDYITRYRKGAGQQAPVFVESDNIRCSENLIKQVFKRVKKKSEINRLHPHLLRHTFATNYIADGGDLETLRLILGHANIQTTQRYLHLAFNLKLQMSRHNSHLDKIYAAEKEQGKNKLA